MSKPIVHDVTSCEPINWKVSVNVSKSNEGTLHTISILFVSGAPVESHRID